MAAGFNYDNFITTDPDEHSIAAAEAAVDKLTNAELVSTFLRLARPENGFVPELHIVADWLMQYHFETGGLI